MSCPRNEGTACGVAAPRPLNDYVITDTKGIKHTAQGDKLTSVNDGNTAIVTKAGKFVSQVNHVLSIVSTAVPVVAPKALPAPKPTVESLQAEIAKLTVQHETRIEELNKRLAHASKRLAKTSARYQNAATSLRNIHDYVLNASFGNRGDSLEAVHEEYHRSARNDERIREEAREGNPAGPGLGLRGAMEALDRLTRNLR